MEVYVPSPHQSPSTLLEQLTAQLGPPLIIKVTEEGRVSISLNQTMLVAIFAEENIILRDPVLKQFFIYIATGVWEGITEERLQHHFEELLRRWAGSLEIYHLRTDHYLSALVRLLRGRVEKKGAFETRPTVINVENGVLRVTSHGYALTEHSPSYYSRNQSDVRFIPNAKCPQFNVFLDTVMPDKDDQLVVQLLGAQFMLGRNFTQRILILWGASNTGKSTLMQMLRMMVGRHNMRELRNGQMDGRFESYAYIDRTLLVGSDVDQDFLSSKGVEVLKKLTGDDFISVERKGCADFKDIMGSLNVAITANPRLRIKIKGQDDADAWRRRIVIIPFRQSPIAAPEDKFAERIIREEGPGILNWLLDGAMQLMERLERKTGLPLNAAQRALVDEWIDASDSLNVFVRGLKHQDETDITSDELCHAYQLYCASHGWTAPSTAYRQMRSVVEEIHGTAQSHDIKRGDQVCRGYRGLTT